MTLLSIITFLVVNRASWPSGQVRGPQFHDTVIDANSTRLQEIIRGQIKMSVNTAGKFKILSSMNVKPNERKIAR